MDGENVSRETSLPSVCGEILHPAVVKNFTLVLTARIEYSADPLFGAAITAQLNSSMALDRLPPLAFTAYGLI
jgi:hypothetical protein